MFLTGFDSKRLNTLYVDKKLKISWTYSKAFSKNRILDEKITKEILFVLEISKKLQMMLLKAI